MSETFDRATVEDRLRRLPDEHRIAFAASCAERLIVHYTLFARSAGWGDPDLLQRGLDAAWNGIASHSDENARRGAKALSEQVDDAIPNEDDFSADYVSEAIDAGVAIVHALLACHDGGPEHGAWSASAVIDTIDRFVRDRDDLAEEDIATPMTDPLMVAELAKQESDLTDLEGQSSLTPDLIQRLRVRAQNNGYSALGLVR
jgi:uncharacterized protein